MYIPCECVYFYIYIPIPIVKIYVYIYNLKKKNMYIWTCTHEYMCTDTAGKLSRRIGGPKMRRQGAGQNDPTALQRGPSPDRWTCLPPHQFSCPWTRFLSHVSGINQKGASSHHGKVSRNSLHIIKQDIYQICNIAFSTAMCSSCRTTRQQQFSISQMVKKWKRIKRINQENLGWRISY